ncbi:hypothetical protein E1B28_013142 [Marasmius oreades]|uniref:DUF6699 domain-containing protein n=1 Tax=Marasmius oreades TaxID=181124 RepID=A0A9P7RP13_9AGAR|nr:uncharacterized protein E1B28_013142 [Marasmius oreades]KAG7087161.1 hypothetical protein E1B28_013142 [Marasmius oreades]
MTMEAGQPDPSVFFKTLASNIKSNLLDVDCAWPYGSPFPPNILKDYMGIIRDTLVLFLAYHHQLGLAARTGQHEFAQTYDQFAVQYPTLNYALTKDMNFRNLARQILRICTEFVRPLSKPIAHLQLAHYPQLLGVYRVRFFDTIDNWVRRFSQGSPPRLYSTPVTVYMNTPVLPNLSNPLPIPPSHHIFPEGRLESLWRRPLSTPSGATPQPQPPVLPFFGTEGGSQSSRIYEIPAMRSSPNPHLEVTRGQTWNSNSPRDNPPEAAGITIPPRAGPVSTTPPPLEMDPRTVQRLISLYDDLMRAVELVEQEGSTFEFAQVAEAFSDALYSIFGPIQDRLSGEIRFWYDEFRMRDQHARMAPVELGTVARYDPAVDFYNRLRSLSILPEDDIPSSPNQEPSFLTIRDPVPIVNAQIDGDTPPQGPSTFLRSTTTSPYGHHGRGVGPSHTSVSPPNAANISGMATPHFGNTVVGADGQEREHAQDTRRAATPLPQRDNDPRVRGIPSTGTGTGTPRRRILRHTTPSSVLHDVDTTMTSGTRGGSISVFQPAPTPALTPPGGVSVEVVQYDATLSFRRRVAPAPAEAGNSNGHNTGISSVPGESPFDVNHSSGGGGMGTGAVNLDRDIRNPAAHGGEPDIHIRVRRNPLTRYSNVSCGRGRNRCCGRRGGGGGYCSCHCNDDGTSNEDESDPLSRPYVHREHQPDLFPPVVDCLPDTIFPTSSPDPSTSLPFPAKIHPSLLHNPMGYLNPVGLRWNITQSPESASFRTKFGMVIPIGLSEDALLVDEGRNVNVFRGTSEHKIWVEADSQYAANSVLQWWMMDQRWGPIKIEKQTTITLRDVLLAIQDYFATPLTLADYQTVVGSPTNTEYSNLDRLVAARRERGRRNDLMEVVMAEDVRYFGNFRRSDVLGTYSTFHGMRTEVRRDGTWVMVMSLGPEVQRYY